MLSQTAQAQQTQKAQVIKAFQAVSGRVADMPIELRPGRGERHDDPLFRIPLPFGHRADTVDTAMQRSTPSPLVAAPVGLNFAGVGSGDYGFVPNAAPPDTNGAVGATQYVQWVNESFAVFNKSTGALVKGPVNGNSLFANLGGPCATNNDGDPIAQYDKVNNRWILTQFSVTTTPFMQCIAVSQTSDATGAYNLYAFSFGNGFNDYPKFGVWPDGYYATYNIFTNGTTFAGASVCAYDGARMRAGLSATTQCFSTSTSFGGLLPSDQDGLTPPPAGSPNYVLNFGTNRLNLWKFHVDFTTPANSTFTGPTSIPVASFAAACNGGTCIPQSGNRRNQRLDSLGDRLMYRLAYRNRGGVESLLVNHSVTAGTSVGIRWYELRITNQTASVFQQSTYAPDATYRWMGSIAMDKVGNIAVGYSASSGSLFPAIRFTGRTPTDTLNTLQAESSIRVGGGIQNGSLTRWGDYSALTVDPVDDCTFWYTTEYLKSTGSFNWSTQIASFRFPGCI
ncbi:hypothetical protein [Anthocerotibacter panamensis]|uniref:hypothetical protein n=1 Tax=Anthocerotibacter panamensis TaxID=2857077 RepID=UPI001C405A69|nr:hypothetical protein [Anthocerotibacter panamensis]